MTEKQTDTDRRVALAWERARRVWGMGRIKYLPGWPDSFTPGEIAALQYPREGTDPEKRRAVTEQRALAAQLAKDIAAGELEIVETDYTPKPTRVVRRIARSNYLASDDWMTRDNSFRVLAFDTSPPPAPVTIKTIERAPFAAWLDALGLEPSAHLVAWLGETLQPAQAPESADKPARKGRKPVSETTESKVAERRAYLQSVWLNLEERSNHRVWVELKARAGKDGCPVIKVDTNIGFTFRYSDETEKPLTKHTFQTDMSAIRNPPTA